MVQRVADAIARARKVNPDIFINMCVDQLTVPPHEENYFRTKLAIAQHAARQELALRLQPDHGHSPHI